MSIFLYSLKTRSINWRTWASSVRDATTASTRAPAWRRLFSSLFHVALCARTNRERGAVLREYFCDGLPDLSVAAYACHQGNFSFKNGRHVRTPRILQVAAQAI